MKRRFLAALLTLVIVLSVFSPAWAAQVEISPVPGKAVQSSSKPVISQEQAVEIAKKAMREIIKPEYKSDAYLEDRYYRGSMKAWRLEWRDERPKAGFSFYLSVMVDATTGDILDLNQQYGQDALKTEVISRQDALKAAENFIKKLQPEKFKEVVLTESPYYYYGDSGYLDLTYRFSWERRVDGIIVEGDGFNVGIDAMSGRVYNYNFMWTPGIVKNISPVVPKEEVKQKVLEGVGLTLSYDYPYEYWSGQGKASPKIIPIYRLNTNFFAYMDAVTGKPMDYSGRVLTWGEIGQFKQEFTYKAGEQASEKAPAERKKISAEAGLQKAEEFFKILGKTGKVRRSGGGTSQGPGGYYEEHWSYSIEPEEQPRGAYRQDVQVGVNVFTGEIANYHRWEEYRGPEKAGEQKLLSRDEAKKQAEEFVNKVRPGLLSKLVLVEEATPPYYKGNNIQQFSWIRLVNGIPFSRDGVRVTINAGTGEVTSYNYSWIIADFAAPEKIISSDEAKAILLGNMKPTLTYIRSNRYEEQPGEPVLVYKFEYPEGALVQADSGKLTGYPGTISKTPVTVEGASNAFSLLLANGFVPQAAAADSEVKRLQAIKAIKAIRGYYYEESEKQVNSFTDVGPEDPDWRVIEGAVASGILTPGGKFNPDLGIDRETLAVWVIKALNYGKIAELPIKIELPVNDKNAISSGAGNYVGLVLGLGIMEAKNGSFKPQEKVTWEEFAGTVIKSTIQSRNNNSRW